MHSFELLHAGILYVMLKRTDSSILHVISFDFLYAIFLETSLFMTSSGKSYYKRTVFFISFVCHLIKLEFHDNLTLGGGGAIFPRGRTDERRHPQVKCILVFMNRGAEKSLARPGRKQSTATEHFDFHISYL
jgi:hypothetical protein